jgi:hypothetical protein
MLFRLAAANDPIGKDRETPPPGPAHSPIPRGGGSAAEPSDLVDAGGVL